MVAGKYDFTIQQGATFSREIDVSEVFPSLANYIARAQIRPTIESSTLYLSLASSDSTLLIDTSALTVTISLAAATTLAQTWTTGVYDMEFVSAGGVVTRLLEGSVTVSKEVTR
jgi:hypothetical protein